MTNQDKKGFAKWLETLQQESWQLELIISGFAIFLLIGTYEPLQAWNREIDAIQAFNSFRSSQFLKLGILVTLVAWHILFVNLIMHVLLRGLWISTIGLRYVSGDIDFETLRLRPKFDKFLRKKIVSFDDYIEQLEKICSVIFAFTFLIIFISISLGLFIAFLLGVIFIAEYLDQSPDNYFVFVFLGLLVLVFIGGLIYLLDFLTFGWLKRQARIDSIYYPIYRFFGFITLSFIYRPLYYNLIDNKFGRWVGLLTIPYLIVFLIVTLLHIETHGYIPRFKKTQSFGNKYYDDIYPENSIHTWASISSKYVKNGFVELYIPYVPSVHDLALEKLCPNLKPATTGVSFDFILNMDDDLRANLNADSVLTCMSSLHQVYINDSLRSDINYRFHHHPIRRDIGLYSIFDVNYLPRGEHQISIKSKYAYNRFRLERDSLTFRQTDIIPFWKE